MLTSKRPSSYRARPQPRRGRKEDPSQEERKSPKLHLAEEPELRRATYFAKLFFVLLAVPLVEKDLENH